MPLFIRHILVPALMPALFFLIVTNPGNALTCRMRGFYALAIALASVLAGIAAAVRASKRRMRGDAGSFLWVISSLILAVPAVALIVLA